MLEGKQGALPIDAGRLEQPSRLDTSNVTVAHASSRARLAYIDVLNVLAAISVVALHCNCFWNGPGQGRSWFSANLIESLLYWPVPVFMMITGATLLGYPDRMDTRTYLRRRLARTLVPFVVWSLVGLALWWWRQARAGAAPEVSLLDVVNGILNAQYVPVYWYFPVLFGVYLAIPVLAPLRHHERLCAYAVATGVALVFAAPLVCKLIGIQWNTALTPPALSGYVTYVLVGWVVATRNVPDRWRPLVYALGCVGFLVQLAGTYILSTPEAGIDATFKDYLNLPAFLQSVAVFTFVRNVDFSKNGVLTRVSSVCGRLSALTLGVYLMHYFVITFIVGVGLVEPRSIWWRTLGAVGVFALCAFATWAIKKVPVVRRIVP